MPYIFFFLDEEPTTPEVTRTPEAPELLAMPTKLRTMKIITSGGKELLLTHARTKTLPGTQNYGSYGGLVHAMRRGARYPELARTFTTQLCVPVDAVELDFGESSSRYHAKSIEDDTIPTCKKCLKILTTSRRA